MFQIFNTADLKSWDSTSNNEIIIWSMAIGLDRYRVRQNITYLVIVRIVQMHCTWSVGYWSAVTSPKGDRS